MPSLPETVAWVCLGWTGIVILVQAIGIRAKCVPLPLVPLLSNPTTACETSNVRRLALCHLGSDRTPPM